jgi:hypothetical protein
VVASTSRWGATGAGGILSKAPPIQQAIQFVPKNSKKNSNSKKPKAPNKINIYINYKMHTGLGAEFK